MGEVAGRQLLVALVGHEPGGRSIGLARGGPDLDLESEALGQDGRGLDGLGLLARHQPPDVGQPGPIGQDSDPTLPDLAQTPTGNRDVGVDPHLRVTDVVEQRPGHGVILASRAGASRPR